MGRIQSSIGLATGFPIQETVEKLIALQARPRDFLVNQNKRLDAQRTAVTALTAQLVAVQLQIKRLAQADVFSQRIVNTSDDTLLDAVSTGTPALGQFQFTPLRQAQAQQLQSSRFITSTQPVGAGTFSFRFGGFIDRALGLELMGAGQGFSPGSLRITDRSGATADIDLSLARDIDDVLDAINAASAIRVRATVHNDSLRLIDETGATAFNLRVQEIGGTTASSLGLAGIDVAATQADGLDMLGLFDDLSLAHLNDGNGVRFDGFAGDLRITTRDGSRINLDFNKFAASGTFARATTTPANGANAAITFTAKEAGPDLGGVNISFVDDTSVTAGSEIVEYEAEAKTLVFRIDQGGTTADQVIAALKKDTEAAAAFIAARAVGSSGTGLVSTADGVVTVGPKSSAVTSGAASARLLIRARNPGGDYDNVAIRFVNDDAITRGSETVTYNGANPANKELVFRIDQGATTANDIITVLALDPVAGQLFSAENFDTSNGQGLISEADTGFTSGGALVAASPQLEEISIKQVLDVINAAAPGKLQASIGADNNLLLTDLSTDAGFTFKVEQLNGSHAASDLGLDGAAIAGTITGRRLLSGLKATLLRSLNGGKGLGTLGVINLTDRNGATASVDLSSAKTVDDVVEAINSAGVGLAARVNDARNGIVLADTTGGTGNLIVANGDATNTADKLGLAIDAAQTTKSSGSLRRQTVSETTLLSSFNGGAGVENGSFTITDNTNKSATVSINSETKTVGDVLEAINRLGLTIAARINDAGDGILLIDSVASGGTLAVREGSGTTARDLHLAVEKSTLLVDGFEKQVIDGTSNFRIDINQTDTLEDVVASINAATPHVRASIFSDGTTVKPFRFTLFNQSAGKAGELLWDTSSAGFTLAETAKAHDALLQIGAPGNGGVLASSNTNEFAGVLPDVKLTIKGAANEPVTIGVEATDSDLVTAVEGFVDAYNRLRDRLKELTRYDEVTQQAAVLQGDGRVLRVESDLNRLVSGRIFGAGAFQSLQTLGIEITDDGRLALDETQLKERFADSPAEVTEFFSKEETGLAARFDNLIEQLAGIGDTVLVGRAAVLTRKIEQNQRRIDFWNARLEKQRQRLLKSFQHSETVIARLQASLSALSAIAPLPPIVPQQ